MPRYQPHPYPHPFSWTSATVYGIWDTRHQKWAAALEECLSTRYEEIQDICDRWNRPHTA